MPRSPLGSVTLILLAHRGPRPSYSVGLRRQSSSSRVWSGAWEAPLRDTGAGGRGSAGTGQRRRPQKPPRVTPGVGPSRRLGRALRRCKYARTYPNATAGRQYVQLLKEHFDSSVFTTRGFSSAAKPLHTHVRSLTSQGTDQGTCMRCDPKPRGR